MRVAFAGVAHSHPFSDAETARLHGVCDLTVWDEDDPGRRTAFSSAWDAREASTLTELLSPRPDVVIVTTRPQRTAATVARVLERGIPCFVNKVAAGSVRSLEDLDRAVRDHQDIFFTSSVLRFAPKVRALSERVGSSRVLGVDVLVRHSIEMFLSEGRRWQDDPGQGGGTAVSMGVHGWEMVDTVCPGEVALLAGSVGRLADSATWSENLAAFQALGPGGQPIQHTVVGVGEGELYRLGVQTEDSFETATVDARDVLRDLGYLDCMGAILEMASGGASPVPWARSRRILATTIAAARLARKTSCVIAGPNG